jgi:hypothetical protein
MRGQKVAERIRKTKWPRGPTIFYNITIFYSKYSISYDLVARRPHKESERSGHEIRRRPPPHESLQSFLKNKKINLVLFRSEDERNERDIGTS